MTADDTSTAPPLSLLTFKAGNKLVVPSCFQLSCQAKLTSCWLWLNPYHTIVLVVSIFPLTLQNKVKKLISLNVKLFLWVSVLEQIFSLCYDLIKLNKVNYMKTLWATDDNACGTFILLAKAEDHALYLHSCSPVQKKEKLMNEFTHLLILSVLSLHTSSCPSVAKWSDGHSPFWLRSNTNMHSIFSLIAASSVWTSPLTA